MTAYTPPSFKSDAFNCPHCHAFTQQVWYSMRRSPIGENVDHGLVHGYYLAVCQRPTCNQISIWETRHPEGQPSPRNMVFPSVTTAPLAIEEMPPTVLEIVNEARDIFDKSPRAACGLLRLAIQVLMPALGEDSKNLNTDIGNLVKKGLSTVIQQGLDSLRVIGNNAVHPGEIDVNDNRDNALALFHILNTIVERTITEQKRIKEVFESLPQSAKDQIAERDKGK